MLLNAILLSVSSIHSEVHSYENACSAYEHTTLIVGSAMTRQTLGAYGVLALPLAMLGLPLYIYLPTFYAQDVGMDVGMVGALLLIARLFDMAIDPFIGIVSDSFTRASMRKLLLQWV